jgi:hypothetical protein
MADLFRERATVDHAMRQKDAPGDGLKPADRAMRSRVERSVLGRTGR